MKKQIATAVVTAAVFWLIPTVQAASPVSQEAAPPPPPGPYLSSRPLLRSAPPPADTAQTQQGHVIPPQRSMQRQQAPAPQPYGYPRYVPERGYPTPSPYGGAYAQPAPRQGVPYGYYPEPRPWQAPAYPPHQGGWRW